MHIRRLFAALAVAALTLSACGKKEAPPPPPAPAPAPAAAPAPAPAGVSVGTVTLGSAIGADKKVANAAESFAKGDTIYASIDTTGTGNATLKAKWTYSKDGQTAVVKEDSMTISTSGPATHEFHVSKPDGWPAGDYQVEIFVDDKPAGARKYSVK